MDVGWFGSKSNQKTETIAKNQGLAALEAKPTPLVSARAEDDPLIRDFRVFSVSKERTRVEAEMLEQRSRQRRCRLGSATARLGSATLASQLGSPGPWLR